jgi:hypothetical protein
MAGGWRQGHVLATNRRPGFLEQVWVSVLLIFIRCVFSFVKICFLSS